MPSIVEQKVTGKEAFAGFRSLVHFHGERAPGPGREQKLWLQPTARGAAPRSRPGSGCDCTSTRRARAPSCRPPGSAESLDRLTPGDADAELRTLPGVGRVDQCRGAPARVRRRRRRQLRRLPRRQGHRLGAARPPDRRRRARRGARGVATPPRPVSRPTSPWPASAPRGAAPGCRCRRTTRRHRWLRRLPWQPSRNPVRGPETRCGSRDGRCAPPHRGTRQSSGRSGARTNSVNLRCRSRASHSSSVSSRQLDSSTREDLLQRRPPWRDVDDLDVDLVVAAEREPVDVGGADGRPGAVDGGRSWRAPWRRGSAGSAPPSPAAGRSSRARSSRPRCGWTSAGSAGARRRRAGPPRFMASTKSWSGMK